MREFLLEHPEFVLDDPEIGEAIRGASRERERQREAAERRAVLEARADLVNSPLTPSLGDPDASVMILEFSDYQCPPCKVSFPELEKVRAADADVRIVFGELPNYGSLSIMAARAATAALRQDRFDALHRALMTTDAPLDIESIYTTAKEVGIDVEELRNDMRDPVVAHHLDEVRALAEALGVTGTPTYIVGDGILRGATTADQFEEAIARERARLLPAGAIPKAP